MSIGVAMLRWPWCHWRLVSLCTADCFTRPAFLSCVKSLLVREDEARDLVRQLGSNWKSGKEIYWISLRITCINGIPVRFFHNRNLNKYLTWNALMLWDALRLHLGCIPQKRDYFMNSSFNMITNNMITSSFNMITQSWWWGSTNRYWRSIWRREFYLCSKLAHLIKYSGWITDLLG